MQVQIQQTEILSDQEILAGLERIKAIIKSFQLKYSVENNPQLNTIGATYG